MVKIARDIVPACVQSVSLEQLYCTAYVSQGPDSETTGGTKILYSPSTGIYKQPLSLHVHAFRSVHLMMNINSLHTLKQWPLTLLYSDPRAV